MDKLTTKFRLVFSAEDADDGEAPAPIDGGRGAEEH
jgi:hypothetical protein